MLPMGLGKSPDYFQMARELLHSPLPSDREYAEIVALETQDEIGDGCELCGSHFHTIDHHHKELFDTESE